jgi:ABC-type dipeptide/oligopeptide/nickel transport system permease subunit
MRKLAIGLTIVALLASTLPVFAQHRHDHGYRPQQHRHYHAPRHRNNNWVPYALGGLALGALGGAYYYNNRQCWDEMIGYDRYGREVFERYCR